MSLVKEMDRIREQVKAETIYLDYDELDEKIVELTARLNLTSKRNYELSIKYDDLQMKMKGKDNG